MFHSSVAFGCLPSRELRVAAIIGVVDLEYQVKDPTLSCVILTSAFNSGKDPSSGVGC